MHVSDARVRDLCVILVDVPSPRGAVTPIVCLCNACLLLRPLHQLLFMSRQATVNGCDIHTKDLAAKVSEGDIAARESRGCQIIGCKIA